MILRQSCRILKTKNQEKKIESESKTKIRQQAQREILQKIKKIQRQIQVKPENRLQVIRKYWKSKVIQNCQRTARVILISQLEKQELHDRNQLTKILQKYVIQKREKDMCNMDEDELPFQPKNYFQSINSSRVRIGQKNFQKELLFNINFKQHLAQLFLNKQSIQMQKCRKNDKSSISYFERKFIVTQILTLFQSKFHIYFSQKKQIYNKEQEVQLIQEKSQSSDIQKNQIIDNDKSPSFPIIPIPLYPIKNIYKDQIEKMQ